MCYTDINEAKRNNLIRIMRRDGVKNTDLAHALKKHTPYISAILAPPEKSNHRNISDKLVDQLSKALRCAKSEFYKGFNDSADQKSEDNQKADVGTLLKIIEQQNERIREQGLLLQAQGERITEQGKRIDVVTMLSSKATTENKDLWDKINSIEKMLGRHYEKMLAAANSGDLKALGE
jgi:plasmid maintenance system antidote protein VapI